jgi:hypothetical protein
MQRQNMSQLEGEDSMQRMNRMVLGLIAIFVLGGSLVLLSCGGDDDDTTDINAGNAASQLGGRQFTFSTQTDFGVTVFSTLAFNAAATRFALIAGNSRGQRERCSMARVSSLLMRVILLLERGHRWA